MNDVSSPLSFNPCSSLKLNLIDSIDWTEQTNQRSEGKSYTKDDEFSFSWKEVSSDKSIDVKAVGNQFLVWANQSIKDTVSETSSLTIYSRLKRILRLSTSSWICYEELSSNTLSSECSICKHLIQLEIIVDAQLKLIFRFHSTHFLIFIQFSGGGKIFIETR